MEDRNWSLVQLAHCFDKIKAAQLEVKVKSVQQMFKFLATKFREKKKINNGQIIDNTNNAKRYVYLLRVIHQFTKEKYNRSFSSYFFADITEQFLLDFSFWVKEHDIKNGNKTGLTHKLRVLHAICNYAKKQEMYGVTKDAFLCLGDDGIKRLEEYHHRDRCVHPHFESVASCSVLWVYFFHLLR